MDRAMLTDSQGDNHQTENHRIQSTRQFDKILCILKIIDIKTMKALVSQWNIIENYTFVS